MIQQEQGGVGQVVGQVITHWWPFIATFLSSASLKVASVYSEKVATLSQPVQWTLLFVIALGFNAVAGFAGVAPLDPLAPVFTASAAEMVLAALLYKLGGIKV